MAGRRVKTEQVAPSMALVASAVSYSGLGKIESVYRPREQWQDDAWDFYDQTPELRFAANWTANALSRCSLTPGQINDNNEIEPAVDKLTSAALKELFGNSDGQSAMLHAMGLHLSVAGECYLVGREVPKEVQSQSGRMWEIVGVREINKSAGGWTINSSIDNRVITLGESDAAIRIWRSHPAHRYQADSPVRALLPVLSEIKYLTLHIFSQTISRLASAGMQVLPKSVEFPGSDKLTEGGKAKGIMELLGKVMGEAMKDPGSASAQIPIFMLVDDAAVDKIKEPLHYWSPFDAKAVTSRQAALQRFYAGFDLPAEVIMGMSAGLSTSGGRGTGLSHWGQWQIEEAAIKMHIEPALDVISTALVIGFIRPLTKNPRAALIANTQALKLQPDRSKEAAEAYQSGALNEEGYLHYNGLDSQYIPDEKAIAKRVLWKMASGSASPEMVLAAAKKLGLDLGITPEDVAGQRIAVPTRPEPSLLDHPTRTMPDRAALLPACEMVVLRALERAGGRLRNSGVRPEGVANEDVYQFAAVNGSAGRLLDGAWRHVPTLAEHFAIDADALTSALQSYTESLMVQKAPYAREALAKYLELVK